MSQSIFPLLIVDSFIPSLWSLPTTALTREYADLNYVKFPIAQGSQTFPSNLSVSGITTLGETTLQTKNSVQATTHYLNFSDSSATGVGAIQKSANLSVVPSTGTLTTSGLITAGGLTISGSNNITLGSGATAPTATGSQLGSVYTGSFSSNIFSSGVDNTYSTITSIPAGTYIVSATGYFASTGVTTYNSRIGYINSSSPSTNIAVDVYQSSVGFPTSATFNTNSVSISGIHQSTSASNLVFRINLTFSGVTPTSSSTNFVFKAVRIA